MGLLHALHGSVADERERQAIRAEIEFAYDAPVHGVSSVTWSQTDFPPRFPKLRKHLRGYAPEGCTVRSVKVWELAPGGKQIPFDL